MYFLWRPLSLLVPNPAQSPVVQSDPRGDGRGYFSWGMTFDQGAEKCDQGAGSCEQSPEWLWSGSRWLSLINRRPSRRRRRRRRRQLYLARHVLTQTPDGFLDHLTIGQLVSM